MSLRSRNRSRRTSRLLVEQLEDRTVPANFVPVLTSLDALLPANTGSMVQLQGTFNDTDVGDPHSVIIDWHDSTPVQKIALAAGAREFQVSHLYANRPTASASIRSISVIVTDQAFATEVAGSSGGFSSSDFRMTGSVLGEPARFTSPSNPFGGAVTPFNAPFGGDEILSLQAGESITVKFPVQVFNNPFSAHAGADFLVFGNAFYNLDFSTGRASGGVFAEPGKIEVSQDGVTFFEITSAFADTAYPTNGYQNPTGAFDLPPANPILTDFGLPVDLTFNETGLTLAQIVAAYNGSGGGTPVDIESTGLQWIQYVRVHGAANGVEVDAFSAVNPLPASVTVGQFNLSRIDERLGLFVDHTGFFQGAAGTHVKWLRGGVANAHGNTWYFLRQNGDLVAWNGKRTASGEMTATGTVQAYFNPQVFVHPELLYQASTATLAGGEAAAAQELDESLGLFVGVDGFRHGNIGPTVKWLRGKANEFGNTWYYLNRAGDFFAWNGEQAASGKRLQEFDAQLFLDPHLLHEASEAVLSPSDAAQAQQFDANLGLFVDVAGFFPNVQGTTAKWLRGQPIVPGAPPWYFIRDNGEFVAWDGTKTAGGKKIASGNVLHQFDAQLFLDPQLLFKAAQSTLPSGQTVQARQFQATLGLFVDVLGYFPNTVNSNAKWLRGQFGKTWYFVRENGEFVAWNGRTDARGRKVSVGTVLFQFDPQVFLNPEPLL